MRGGAGGVQPRPSVVLGGLLFGAILLSVAGCAGDDESASASDAAATGLDFDFYVSNVEPIFTRSRGGFALGNPGGPSCVMCHTWQTNAPLKLEALQEGPGGETFWTEDQSRSNFAEVARLVTPGDPDNSRLLRVPLAVSEGGRGQHTGGTFWESKDDPEWQVLAEWVRMADPAADAVAEAPPRRRLRVLPELCTAGLPDHHTGRAPLYGMSRWRPCGIRRAHRGRARLLERGGVAGEFRSGDAASQARRANPKPSSHASPRVRRRR